MDGEKMRENTASSTPFESGPTSKTDRSFSEEFRERGDSLLRNGKDSMVMELDRISEAFHTASDTLHKRNDIAAGIADSITVKIDDASRYLKEHQSGDVINGINNFAKNNPLFTAGGMFAAGLALSRFLKAGHEEQKPDREV